MASPNEEERTMLKIRRRAWFVLLAGFVVGFGILIARLFQLQIVEGASYKAAALSQRTSTVTLPAKRGSILDRNEKVLAQSVAVWNICISPAEIVPEQLDDIATNLSEILEVDKDFILGKAENKESYYAEIKMKVDNHTRQKVEDYIKGGYRGDKISGIFWRPSTKRYYQHDNLASSLIGFTDYENKGAYGLEAYYESVLAGTPGISVSGTNPRDLDLTGGTSFPAEDGYSIVLTIDETAQSILEKHLEMAVVEHDVKNEAIGIVMNIKTGEIIALANKPDFDPNKPFEIYDDNARALLEDLEEGTEEYKELESELRFNQWKNKAISDAYEPGSVYKIVTAAIALEGQHSYLNDTFNCTGSIEVADRTINCHYRYGHGVQDFYDIVRNSCNPAFVTLGLRNGAEETYRYMTDFGLGKPTGIDLPGEDVGILHTVESLSGYGQVPLASTSFGQSFTTTPIQLITAVSAAVNGGNLVQPYVVKQIRDSKGNVVETIQPKIKRQVISEETSKEMQELVEVVVSNGSGRNAAIPGYRIGGKTGTSEKLTNSENDPKEYVLSFVGFAPMEDPTYACLVALDDPYVANPWGSVIAAPVVGAIFQEMLPVLGVEPHFTDEELAQMPVEVPYLIDWKPHDAQSELTSKGLKTKIVGGGSSVIRQIPTSGQSISKGGQVSLYTSEEMLNPNIKLPDFIGMSTEKVKESLNALELNVEFRGVTSPEAIVGKQWPVSGETLTTADTVILTMVQDEDNVVSDIMPDMVPVPKPSPEQEGQWEDVTDGEVDMAAPNISDQPLQDFNEFGEILEKEEEKKTTKPKEKKEVIPKVKEKTEFGEILDG